MILNVRCRLLQRETSVLPLRLWMASSLATSPQAANYCGRPGFRRLPRPSSRLALPKNVLAVLITVFWYFCFIILVFYHSHSLDSSGTRRSWPLYLRRSVTVGLRRGSLHI